MGLQHFNIDLDRQVGGRDSFDAVWEHPERKAVTSCILKKREKNEYRKGREEEEKKHKKKIKKIKKVLIFTVKIQKQ